MRPHGIVALWLVLAGLLGALAVGESARAGMWFQDATPAAGTPVPTTDAVTLVAWYAPAPPDGSFLVVTPLETDNRLVATAETPVPAGTLTGRSDFPEDGSPPTITLGETTFTSYARVADDPSSVLRWTWFDDVELGRPGTLVLQVNATGGAYEGWVGTATFVSRGSDVGGVLIIVVNPPAA